jgi:hypothetical protein
MKPPTSDEEMLDKLERLTFEYFLHEDNPANGLIADKTQKGSPASIAAVGLALSAYPVGIERGFCSRATARQKTLRTAILLEQSPGCQNRRNWLQGLLLPLPRHGERKARLAVRAVDG